MAPIRSIGNLCDQIAEDDELVARFKADPSPILLMIARSESRRAHNDSFIYRCIVIVLCLILLSILAFALTVNGQIAYEHIMHSKEITPVPLPEYIIALGSTALGALAGLLAPSPSGRADDA